MLSFSSVLLVALTLIDTRYAVHAPRSRLHKLDCKVSRQKVLGNSDEEGAVLFIGAHVGNSFEADEDQWKYLSSKKMSHLWKVFVEPLPLHHALLQTSIRKRKVANVTVLPTAAIPTPTAAAASPSVDFFCCLDRETGKFNSNNTPSLSQVHTNHFCSLRENHPYLEHLLAGESGGGGVWKVPVPALTLENLLPAASAAIRASGDNGAGKAGREGSCVDGLCPVRLLILDTGDEGDFLLLHDLHSVNEHSPLFRPAVLSVNFFSFTQEQFNTTLQLLHDMQYMTCVARKRKGKHLHAFHQSALLKLQGVQFL